MDENTNPQAPAMDPVTEEKKEGEVVEGVEMPATDAPATDEAAA